MAKTDEDGKESFPLLQKYTQWQVSLQELERKGRMIDWAAEKYQFVRALNWNNSRNTVGKRWREENVN